VPDIFWARTSVLEVLVQRGSMGDILKVIALLGLGGIGIGALDNIDLRALNGTGLEGVANDMKQTVNYLKKDAMSNFHDLINTVNNARR
jgi:hypothetical protein